MFHFLLLRVKLTFTVREPFILLGLCLMILLALTTLEFICDIK